MEAKIHRDGSKSTMYLQSPTNKNDNLIFMAEKKRTLFTIADLGNMYGGAHRLTGSSLFKTKRRGSTIGYSWYLDYSFAKTSSKEVASILHEISSVMKVLKDGPPRRAQVFIAGRVLLETKEPC